MNFSQSEKKMIVCLKICFHVLQSLHYVRLVDKYKVKGARVKFFFIFIFTVIETDGKISCRERVGIKLAIFAIDCFNQLNRLFISMCIAFQKDMHVNVMSKITHFDFHNH